MNRWVDEAKVLGKIGDPSDRAAVQRYLRSCPEVPPLVGAKVAADLLGIPAPHISRYREQGRMPDGVEVEGTANAYIRDEVEAFAEELEAERAERERRRAERRRS